MQEYRGEKKREEKETERKETSGKSVDPSGRRPPIKIQLISG